MTVIETLIVIGGIIITAIAGIFVYTRDLNLAFARCISYTFTILVLACIYFLSVTTILSILTPEQMVLEITPLGFSALFSALLIAFLFPPVKKFFNRLADKLLYRGNYSIGQFVDRINQALNSTNDLRTLLERVGSVIAASLNTHQAFFLAHLPEGRYITAGTEHHAKVLPTEFLESEGYYQEEQVIQVAELEVAHPLRRMMVSHRIGLIMPLYKNEEIVGYLCLGDARKISYTSRDLHALTIIADELAIAMQNALSVEEVRKLNDTLEQRIHFATKELRTSNAQLQRLDEAKDEFISMASHQLRTPLTSIKGYISMLIDGDMGRITKEQKQVLNEVFVSSERMVRLIGDFLNVSRLQTGRFVIEKRPIDLAKLVDREIEGLEQNAAARGVKFTYKKPKNIPKLALDENKIQQVVMNFADNAIYYSKEKTKVTVTLQKVGDFVEFTVQDTGIGVPQSEQAQLFNKFFRATNARKARPDGTGVGLFLAKKVITDHDGEIIFESTEGKGSTFGFRLPVPRDKS